LCKTSDIKTRWRSNSTVFTRTIFFFYLQDCCEACKLGLISGSMGTACVFQNFEFGPPWDEAHHACCLEAQPSTTLPSTTSTNVTVSNAEKKTTVIPTPGEEYVFHDFQNSIF
jgi:hypothetical protein